ncbi:MAG: hypothetical protein R6X09_07415 [Bacteroidales bacterium]
MELKPLKIGKSTIKPKKAILLALLIIGFGIGITAALQEKNLIILIGCSLIGISIIVFTLSRYK